MNIMYFNMKEFRIQKMYVYVYFNMLLQYTSDSLK